MHLVPTCSLTLHKLLTWQLILHWNANAWSARLRDFTLCALNFLSALNREEVKIYEFYESRKEFLSFIQNKRLRSQEWFDEVPSPQRCNSKAHSKSVNILKTFFVSLNKATECPEDLKTKEIERRSETYNLTCEKGLGMHLDGNLTSSFIMSSWMK